MSTVDPSGTEATPFRDTKPVSWNGARIPEKPSVVFVGSFTNTSPESALTTLVSPGTGGTLPGGRTSQALPTPSASLSAWSELATAGQLSRESGTPSPSVSATGTGVATGASTVKSACAGVRMSSAPYSSLATTASRCAPGASPANVTGFVHAANVPRSIEHS